MQIEMNEKQIGTMLDAIASIPMTVETNEIKDLLESHILGKPQDKWKKQAPKVKPTSKLTFTRERD